MVTFKNIKKNIFDHDPQAPADIENDIKLWDAVMACKANELAYKSHITENGILCSDKAKFHRPQAIKDVLDHIPKGTKVVMVVAGTGRYLSQDLEEFLSEDKTPEQKSEIFEKLEIMREERAAIGVLGSVLTGNEIEEIENYMTSGADPYFKSLLGEENMIDLTPRLSPHKYEERSRFPSKNFLDSSRDNMMKILKCNRAFLKEEDQKIRNLAQMLVDNLHLLGRMDDQKYARVSEKIARTSSSMNDIEQDVQDIEKELEADAVSSKNLKGIWQKFVRYIAPQEPHNDNTSQSPAKKGTPPKNNM